MIFEKTCFKVWPSEMCCDGLLWCCDGVVTGENVVVTVLWWCCDGLLWRCARRNKENANKYEQNANKIRTLQNPWICRNFNHVYLFSRRARNILRPPIDQDNFSLSNENIRFGLCWCGISTVQSLFNMKWQMVSSSRKNANKCEHNPSKMRTISEH